ncbi:MAG: hypothetical protein C0466_11080 [Candidatus Accumulibacter sp.]|nr:hypothetical protein [Accumulibacter sp.]
MTPTPTPLDRHFNLPEVRRIAPDRPLVWLRAGWRDLAANPIASLSYGLLFAIGGDFILIFAWRSPQLFTAAVSGFFLIAPLLAGGLYEISRRRAAGRSSTFVDSLAGWRRNGQSIAMFGLLLALIGIAWERISAILFALLAPDLTPDLAAFVSSIFTSGAYRGLLAAWLVAGGSLALLVFAISAVSVPMLLDRDADFVTAMMTSLRAVGLNLETMVLWAALIVVLTLLGFATLLFGLVVLMPLIGHASWHAYRDLVK